MQHGEKLTLVAVGGRPSLVKFMPGSQCRSVTQVVWLASTRLRWLPFTTAVRPLSSPAPSSLLVLPSSAEPLLCAMRSCTTCATCAAVVLGHHCCMLSTLEVCPKNAEIKECMILGLMPRLALLCTQQVKHGCGERFCLVRNGDPNGKQSSRWRI